ncbi:MAG: hypothetical protein JSR28_01200 [Proteobacteria bacterium]|nr:hypothetical protein [Pseudomonadota bacterium]
MFTVPPSNPVTGKSIQLIPETIDDQHSTAEGSAVSSTLSQALNQVGSHPSTLLSTNLASVLDSSSRRWLRFGLIVAIALGMVALAALVVALGTGLAQLVDAVTP